MITFQSSSVYHVQFTARSGVTREKSIAVALCVETSGILVSLPSFSRHKLESTIFSTSLLKVTDVHPFSPKGACALKSPT